MTNCKENCNDCPGEAHYTGTDECAGGGRCPYDRKHCHDMDFHHFSSFYELNKYWCIPGCSRYNFPKNK